MYPVLNRHNDNFCYTKHLMTICPIHIMSSKWPFIHYFLKDTSMHAKFLWNLQYLLKLGNKSTKYPFLKNGKRMGTLYNYFLVDFTYLVFHHCNHYLTNRLLLYCPVYDSQSGIMTISLWILPIWCFIMATIILLVAYCCFIAQCMWCDSQRRIRTNSFRWILPIVLEVPRTNECCLFLVPVAWHGWHCNSGNT